MAYKFGQLRENQISSYLTPLEYTFQEAEESTSDWKVLLSGENILKGQDDNKNQCSYYLRFKVFKSALYAQTINVTLINSNKLEDNTRVIKTINIEKGNSSSFLTFELVISPNENYTYNQIYFEFVKSAFDTADYPRMNITIQRLDKIYNVIDYLRPFIDGKKILKQIGVQGPSGLLMSINGEDIRIGRSGLYEINYGIDVSFIGFIIENHEHQFLLDYQYS